MSRKRKKANHSITGKAVTRNILRFDFQADSSSDLQQTSPHPAHPRGDRPGFAVRPVSWGHFCGYAIRHQGQNFPNARFLSAGCGMRIGENPMEAAHPAPGVILLGFR